MSDEGSEDFDGVIEFDDGARYRVEQKPNASPETLPERSKTPSEPEGPPVAKEERFGEEMSRSWPRGPLPSSIQPSIHKPSLQLSVSSHPASESPSQTQSPHEGISPTSRVLFNERLNRLEPLPESKAPFQSRQREQPSAPQALSSNIQVLQKGLPGTDFKNRGPPRGFGTERNPWSDNASFRGQSLKDEERPWESRRRESVSSATGSSIRDRSRGRENRWEPSHHAIGNDREHMHRSINAPPLPPSLTREREGNRGSQFRPPPFTSVPPGKGPERESVHSNLSNASPAISTRSLHSPVLEKSQLFASQPTDIPEDLDKNALLKDAMHLANERAKRRKQELDEEERRREEAAERARKKAEALALAMETKRKTERQASPEPSKSLVNVSRWLLLVMRILTNDHNKDDDRKREPKTVTTASTGTQQVIREQSNKQSPVNQPPLTNLNPQSLLLSRRPTSSSSPATQADSWRSKAPLKNSVTETLDAESVTVVKKNSQIGFPAPHDNSVPSSLPPQPPPDLHNLSIKPDEQVEIVDFEDLGKFLGNAPQESFVPPKPPQRFSNRPVASDFFREESVEPEPLSWRRQAVIPQTTSAPDGLRTQTMPIFSGEPSPETDLSATEQKSSQSPSMSPSKRLSHGDHSTSNPQISPVLSVLRSPRVSHFREAPMSALTDTMSRIKGALDGMQCQDIPPKDKAIADKARFSVSETLLRDNIPHQDDSAPLLSHHPEEFVSRIPPPPSPKPVWNTYTVKVPKVSQQREPLPKKQVHYWNLPYPAVRWEILSWDPPVEGMNKRDLSRDDIFHRKIPFKGGKPRVLLPQSNNQQAINPPTSYKDTSTISTSMVIDARVRVKLPSGPSKFPITTSTENTRELVYIPSWRRSANPPSLAKMEQTHVVLSEELNTTSRSPPPDPSTPLSQLTPVKKEAPTKSEGPPPANVSLPSTDNKLTDRGPYEAVSFLRTRGTGIGEQSTTRLSPNFTVGSELESFTSDALDQAVKTTVNSSAPEPSQVDMKPTPPFTPTSHEIPTPLPRLIASKPGSKSSEESVSA